jgi:hypothetical protein
MRPSPARLKNTYAILGVAVLAALVISVPFAGASVVAPTIDSSTPSSPANNNDPTLNGTAGAKAVLVTLHTDSACSSPPVATGKPVEGHFAIQVHVADDSSTAFYAAAANKDAEVSPCSSGFTYVEDSTPPPVPVIVSAPASPSGSGAASFTFTDDETAVFRCQLDGGAFSDCSGGSANYSGLADGAHAFVVKAVDQAGNESGIASYAWTIDTTQPIATITDKPPLITNQPTASFSFAAPQASSTYQCSLDGAPLRACTSPQLYPGLPDGRHTFTVQATHLGTTGPPAQYSWTIDTLAPDTAIASRPPNPSTSASAAFSFTSSEAGASFWCSLDGAGFTPCSSPKSYSGLSNGSHTFKVQAVDAAGNSDSTPATYSWQIAGTRGTTTDHRPPGNVRRLIRNVSYRLLELQWRNPRDGDFDHVSVYVSTSAKTAARTLVFSGKARRYRDHRFKNGLYYRYRVVSYDHAGNASPGVPKPVSPSILLLSPGNGQIVHSPPRLRWAAVRRATFYNVQLYRGAKKILSAWPSKARLGLRRSWTYGGRRFHLTRGTYHWYVWPAFGPRSASHYGQLLGQGSFRVRQP